MTNRIRIMLIAVMLLQTLAMIFGGLTSINMIRVMRLQTELAQKQNATIQTQRETIETQRRVILSCTSHQGPSI